MRHPRVRYAYQAVEPSAVPEGGVAPRSNVYLHGASPHERLEAYISICRQLVPNIAHEKLIYDSQNCGACNVVLTKSGLVSGGATFRLVSIDMVPCKGTPKNCATERTLVVDILLTAVASKLQGRGVGTKIVEYIRQLGIDQAAAHGMRSCLILVQADNSAIDFWRKVGMREGKEARRLVAALSRWRAEDNTIYDGATPMSLHLMHAPLVPTGPDATPPPVLKYEIKVKVQRGCCL